MTDQERIDHILKNLLELASGNFFIEDLKEVKNDQIGAIDRGVFMLGEQLQEDRHQQKKLLLEKETLLKEVHHRVKNNLQVISSLLNLQAHKIDQPEIMSVFQQSQERINAIALVHKMLYQSEDLSRIIYADYLNQLVNNLVESIVRDKFKVEVSTISQVKTLDINTAVPLGLIINEIVTNSLTHAFNGWESGKIYVEFTKEGDIYTLKIGDDGIGYSNDLLINGSAESLGLTLITTLVDQIEGELEKEQGEGTHYTIKFKIEE